MEPFRHVTILNVELSRRFFIRQGLHMNNLGEERNAIKIANAVTTVLQKNENGISVSDVSYKNNAITQEILKQPHWSKSTKKLQLMLQPRKKLVDEVNRTVENETQSVNL